MPNFNRMVERIKNLIREVNGIKEREQEMQRKMLQLENALFHPWSRSVGLHAQPAPEDVRVVVKVTDASNQNYIEGKPQYPTALNTWADVSATEVVRVGAPNHNFSVNDIVLAFFDGQDFNPTQDDPPTPPEAIFHAIMTSAGNNIYVVNANGASAGIYDCHVTGGSGGGTNVTHWQEFALGLTGHRLEAGDQLLSATVGSTIYGLSGYSFGPDES